MSHPANKSEASGTGYESAPVKTGRLLAFGAAVVVMVVAGLLVSDAVFHMIVRIQPMGPPATPFEVGREMPPAPRLQTAAPLDLKRYRDDQNKTLDSYGWVDSQAGIVRIPVERAMDLLLQKGYPLRGSSAVKGPANVPGVQPPPGRPLTAPMPGDGQEVQ